MAVYQEGKKPGVWGQSPQVYPHKTAKSQIFWGLDDGNVTGARRFHAQVGAVMVVHAGFATLLAASPRREGTLGKLRLGPVQKALQERMAG